MLLQDHSTTGGSAVCSCTTEELGRMQLRDGEHRRVVNLRAVWWSGTVVRIDREVREGACENSTRLGARADGW